MKELGIENSPPYSQQSARATRLYESLYTLAIFLARWNRSVFLTEFDIWKFNYNSLPYKQEVTVKQMFLFRGDVTKRANH
jgi:hypothetical protein